MDIEAYIQREASDDTDHDRAYAKALRNAHAYYNGMARDALIYEQMKARRYYADGGPTHMNTARCMVIMQLLEEA